MKRGNSIFRSFHHAIAGILYCLRAERNMKVHCIAAAAVGVLAWRLELECRDLLILLLTVTSVLVAELFNTAIERVVDIVSPEFHPLAKIAKDVSAGAVLVTAAASLLVGYLLLLPRLLG